MSFIAKYKGTCTWCTESIDVGDACSYWNNCIYHDGRGNDCLAKAKDDEIASKILKADAIQKYREENGYL